jgi:hypothetical protein
MSEKPLADAVLADALGQVIAEQRRAWEQQWQLQMQTIAAEARAAVAEIRLAAVEALLEKHVPAEVIERLRIVGGRRD